MGISSAFQNAIEISSDSNSSTAPNSIVEECDCSVIDNNKYSSNINTVAFTNSSNIQIGDRVVYNGPVTITQELSNTDKDKPETQNFQNKQKSLDLKKKIIYLAMSILLILMVILGIFYGLKKPNPKPTNYELKIIPRNEWGAKPPADDELIMLKLPLDKIIISHTVMRNCFTKEFCAINMREMQDIHMNWDFGDIGFNFVIGNDGNVYEGNIIINFGGDTLTILKKIKGRGWEIMGAHTKGYNSVSFGIAFNGNFVNEVPNRNQIMAAFALFDEGVRLGKLTPDYKIYGMRQFKGTESPGEALFQMMKTWDHWSEEYNTVEYNWV